ncbi:uncharacterized protein LOC117293405 [Asterias rubens]|uniref:uncharacterized protein LOC117293405 n=1 Tax=Asterias rubens TaxID=7604 RepID=UPI001454FAB0|nr:uncharacterized protein LOC117293405 [Asterias rubens]
MNVNGKCTGNCCIRKGWPKHRGRDCSFIRRQGFKTSANVIHLVEDSLVIFPDTEMEYKSHFKVQHIQLLGRKKTTGKGFCFNIPAILLLIEKIEYPQWLAKLLSGHISRFIITELLGRKKTRKGFCFYIPAFYLLIEKIEVHFDKDQFEPRPKD